MNDTGLQRKAAPGRKHITGDDGRLHPCSLTSSGMRIDTFNRSRGRRLSSGTSELAGFTPILGVKVQTLHGQPADVTRISCIRTSRAMQLSDDRSMS